MSAKFNHIFFSIYKAPIHAPILGYNEATYKEFTYERVLLLYLDVKPVLNTRQN